MKTFIKQLLRENISTQSNPISISKKYGSVEGIIHRDLIRVNNWFGSRHINSEKYIHFIKLPIAFLNNINVDERYRKKGYGNNLYSEFESECFENDVQTIILESDSGEQQTNGFNLDNWYESFDFDKIGVESGNSIFLKYLS